MFTAKDIEYRSVFVVNCIENKALRVSNGALLLEDTEEKRTLTKLPFQKILVLFVIGHITITTPLIENCTRNGIPLVVMKPNFRPVFFFSITAEANYLLRKKQHETDKNDLCIPKILVANKIRNQQRLLEKTRLKTESVLKARLLCENALSLIAGTNDYEMVMGLEGRVAKSFFAAYFEQHGWKSRSQIGRAHV